MKRKFGLYHHKLITCKKSQVHKGSSRRKMILQENKQSANMNTNYKMIKKPKIPIKKEEIAFLKIRRNLGLVPLLKTTIITKPENKLLARQLSICIGKNLLKIKILIRFKCLNLPSLITSASMIKILLERVSKI